MHVRLPGRRVIVAHAFPSTDVEFASAVSTELDAARESTTDAEDLRQAVTLALRRAYPDAHLVVQGRLARVVEAQETWYVFRDAGAPPDPRTRR